MLSPYRVLDLTDERGQLTGFMLAQLGAEVILVEPPGGSTSRTIGPFAGGQIDAESSLRHLAYNRGKTSIVLDLASSEADRERLRQLALGADVVIESGRPGALAELGLGPDDLGGINPALIYTSISPFGQTGPKAEWQASDLTLWASAGPQFLTGDSDRPPLRPPSDQAFIHGAAEAAGATIAALIERSNSGLGQHVDVSVQQAAAQATQSNVLSVSNGDTMATREAGGLVIADIFLKLRWPCADGHVSVTFLFGSALGVASQRLMKVMFDLGFCDADIRDKDWLGYTVKLLSGEEPVSEYDRAKACVGAFCAAHTKAELLDLAQQHRLLIAPVNMIDDVVGLSQFEEREFWDEVDGVRYPGPFAKASATPLERPGAVRPVGADTAAILAAPARTPATTAPAETTIDLTGNHALPLAGVKVLDFMWVMAGPAGTRVLTDLGATVVRLESAARIDTARTLQPFRHGESDLETSCLFANMNAGKLGLSVNPSTDEGKAVIADLVRWADVVTESFSPKAMAAWGLDYESLRKVNPSIVMLSSCLFGQTGPLAQFAGYGTMAAAMTGFFGITGWPDRAPSGPFGAYTDYISPRFANAALLAAIDHRRRTGEGQHIDFAQAEGSLHAIAPLLLDYMINHNVTTPMGNQDGRHDPAGVYPCAGDEDWIAITCASDAERAALTALTGGIDDEAIAGWTSTQPGADAQETLQAAGVAAHIVANATTMPHDGQLVHRGHFATVPHASLGDVTVEGPRFKMSRTPAAVGGPPTLGQDTTTVLTDLLGYDEERLVELLISGALE